MNTQGVKTSQRARLLALLVGILILGVIGQSYFINSYLLADFRRLEENQVRASLRQITLLLDNFLHPLDRLTAQAGAWDETHRALDAGYVEAWKQELEALYRRNPAFDAAALIAPDGILLTGFSINPLTQQATDLPEAAASLMQRHTGTARDGASSGWMAVNDGLFASAARSLGEADTPSAYIVLGRYFNSNELTSLEDLSGTRLTLTPAANNPDLQAGMGLGELQRGGEGNRALELCKTLTPALNPQRELICVKLQDSVYLRGKASADDLRLATLSGFVLLIVTAWLFLDRALLRRLQILVKQLGAAGAAGTEALEQALLKDSLREDELGQLSGGMGQLLTRVRKGEAELRQQQSNFRGLTESTGVGIFVMTQRILYANPFAEALTGYSFQELLNYRLPDLLHRNDRERVETRVRNALTGSAKASTADEVRGRRKDGGQYWARLHTVALHYQGAPAVLVTLYDTSEQRHLEAVIAREKERLQVILASIQDGIVSLDSGSRVNYLNTAAERLIGHTVDSAMGKPLQEIALFSDPQTKQPLPPSTLERMSANSPATQASVMTPTGDQRLLELRRSPLISSEGGDRPGSVVVLRDVSELRRMTQNLEYQATHDELTGLVNRREFNHRLREAIQECRQSGASIALCYLDLDQFKTVNDICGHHAGDLMLQQITAALRALTRESDTLARLGGDEFGLLLRCSPEQAQITGNKLRGAISEVRFVWSGRAFAVDASIGIAMLNHIEGNIDEALSLADATCYMAKEEGRNRVRMYRPGDVDLQRQFGQMRWAQKLKDALDQDQFLLYQQGIHSLKQPAIGPAACEVLIRLRETEGKIISAGDFLDAAERYQMMPTLDRFVVQGVLTHMVTERKMLGSIARRYFVNLSGQSLGDETFHDFLLDAFGPKSSELASNIVFEVTETSVISNLGKARRIMQLLRERGCSFALDDFGTGMSSFGYLKELEVQYLKIAGPFVKYLPRNSKDQAIVRNFTNFGQQMNLQVIAEWVEDQATFDLLREMGVDYAQGFALDLPAPLDLKAPESALALG